MVLGIPSIILMVRTVLPANGLLILVGKLNENVVLGVKR